MASPDIPKPFPSLFGDGTPGSTSMHLGTLPDIVATPPDAVSPSSDGWGAIHTECLQGSTGSMETIMGCAIIDSSVAASDDKSDHNMASGDINVFGEPDLANSDEAKGEDKQPPEILKPSPEQAEEIIICDRENREKPDLLSETFQKTNPLGCEPRQNSTPPSEQYEVNSLFDEDINGSQDGKDLENTKEKGRSPNTQVKDHQSDGDDAGLYISDQDAQLDIRQQSSEDEPLFFSDDDSLRSEDGLNESIPSTPPTPEWPRLRLRQQDLGRMFTIDIDQDESGDYRNGTGKLPEEIANSNPERRKRPAPQPRNGDETPQEQTTRPTTTIRFDRRNGLTCQIVFKSNSERWLDKLRTIKCDDSTHTDGRPRGTDHLHHPAIEDQPNQTLVNPNLIPDSQLRERNVQAVQAQDDSEPMPQLGDPRARGCRACLLSGGQCSLVCGSKYPCNTCSDESKDCELVMEPEYKESCSTCGRSKCSFKENRKQRGPCDQCLEKGAYCIYGPASGYTRTNPVCGEDPLVFKAKRKLKMEQEKKGNKLPKPTAQSNTRTEEDVPVQGGRRCQQLKTPTLRAPVRSSRNRLSSRNGDQGGNSRPAKRRKLNQNHSPVRNQIPASRLTAHQGPGRVFSRQQLPPRQNHSRFGHPFRQHEHVGQNINLWRPGPASVKLQTWSREEGDGDPPALPAGLFERCASSSRNGTPLPTPPLTPPQAESTSRLLPEERGRYMMSGALPSRPRVFGQPKVIKTRLFHPVEINDKIFPCSWCTLESKPMMLLGMEERTITAQETQDGFFEVDQDGNVQEHADNEELRARLCVQCTMDRIFVTNCESHSFHTILGSHELPLEEVLDKLIDDENHKFKTSNFCSICPSLARFECMTLGLRNHTANTNGQYVPGGCGLKACSACRDKLKENGRDVTALVDDLESSRGADDFPATRADAFLFSHVPKRIACSGEC